MKYESEVCISISDKAKLQYFLVKYETSLWKARIKIFHIFSCLKK